MVRAGRTSLATSSLELHNGSFSSSHCYTTLFIYEDLFHTSLQEDAVWLFSPLLLPFAAPELSQSWRALKIHAKHAPRETLLSLGLLAQSISLTYTELSDMAHILSCATWGELGIKYHTQWPIFSCVCLDHFLAPLAPGSLFSVVAGACTQKICWLVCRWRFTSMAFLWVTGQCIPTWVLSIWSLLGH